MAKFIVFFDFGYNLEELKAIKNYFFKLASYFSNTYGTPIARHGKIECSVSSVCSWCYIWHDMIGGSVSVLHKYK